MGRLFIVRHGQASFLEPDYDRLSTKGEAQSRLLGEYWAGLGVVFDLVYTGPRKRQRDTAGIVGEVYRQAGLDWPEPVIVADFDEFKAEAVLEHALAGLLKTDDHVRRLHQDFQDARGTDDRFRTFQRVFEVVIGRWARRELEVPGIEPWADFCTRVQRGLERLLDNGNGGRNLVIFSSGGPGGVAMKKALDLSIDGTLKSAWMMRNSAYSEFLFSPERFTLSTYNANPHLTDPEFITYR
ncbi:MAG TPA: histidine phosphatase family protein [Candidatus Angelobacter sp.]|nr:histidine phosphatase family protein [Candidatus Angelobacter sp.]